MKSSPLRKIVLWSVLALIICVAGISFHVHNQRHPSTDNAYLQANTISIAAQVTGPVTFIYVNNYQAVKKGQLLASIDPLPFQLALTKAEAQYELTHQKYGANTAAVAVAKATVNERKAELLLAEKNAQRILPLVRNGQLSKATGDQTQSQLDSTKAALMIAENQLSQAQENLGAANDSNAELKAAKATLDLAKLNLAYTHIIAPADGMVTNFNLRTGTLITANQPLFVLIDTSAWWVDANFKETQLERIRPGQKATIHMDSYPGKSFQGVVSAINGGSGASFSLLPAENATGNWVKVIQRFTVRVTLISQDKHFPLRIGSSCDIKIDTTGNG